MSDEPEAYRPRRAWRDEQSSAAESATPDSGPTDRPIESDDGGPPAETQPAADGVADPKADHDADAEVPDAGGRWGRRPESRSRGRTASALSRRVDSGPFSSVRRRHDSGPRSLRRDDHPEPGPGAQTQSGGA